MVQLLAGFWAGSPQLIEDIDFDIDASLGGYTKANAVRPFRSVLFAALGIKASKISRGSHAYCCADC
jgi:hypothetical protein